MYLKASFIVNAKQGQAVELKASSRTDSRSRGFLGEHFVVQSGELSLGISSQSARSNISTAGGNQRAFMCTLYQSA